MNSGSLHGCVIRARENLWLTRARLDARLDYEGCSRGEAWRRLRRLAGLARKAALKHRRYVHKVLQLKLDSLPPRVEPDSIFTGQWVGIIEDNEATLIVEPKLKEFSRIYLRVVKELADAEPLLLALAGLHIGPQAALPSLSLAAMILDEYVESTPPYIIEEQRLSIPPVTIAKRTKPNTRLEATTLIAAAILARAARQAIETLKEIGTVAVFLEPLAQLAITREQATLEQVTLRLALSSSHATQGEFDTELLAQLALATRVSPTVHAGGEATQLLLAPAPKIYELYVLLSLGEALQRYGWSLGGRSLHRWSFSRDGESLILYYNKPPSRISRLVYRLSGSPPHPDILALRGARSRRKTASIVVDAKYLEVRKGLRLADAIRLLGYAADLARNHVLYAAVAAPYVEEDLARYYAEKLDGAWIAVSLMEVSPRVNQLTQLAERL